MDQYLLLRDNKQTGPYSRQEIIEKGFKPYDLIWVEGKSAGWRYPSELPEFKAHTPVVEEQPFDRFYKKPSHELHAHEIIELEKAREKITRPDTVFTKGVEQKPIEQKQVELKPVEQKPVEQKPVEQKPVEHKPVEQKPVEQIPTQQEPEIPAQVKREREVAVKSKEAKIVRIRPKKAFATGEPHQHISSEIEPVTNTLVPHKTDDVAPVHNPEPQFEKNEKPAIPEEDYNVSRYESKVMDTSASQYYQRYTKQVQPNFTNEPVEEKVYVRVSQKPDRMKMWLRGAVAACLILGGVVIGLLISYTRQNPQRQQLDQFVRQLQEKEKTKAVQGNNLPTEQNKDAIADVTSTRPAETISEKTEPEGNKVLPKESTRRKINEEPGDQTSGSIIQPAVIKKQEEPVVSTPGNGEINENARRNIFELISLEGSDYKIGVLGGISNLQLTISNNSLYAIDEVQVQVNYFGPEKKLVKQQTVIISEVAPGGQKTVPVPKSNRGVSVSYSITKINSKALGIAQASFQTP